VAGERREVVTRRPERIGLWSGIVEILSWNRARFSVVVEASCCVAAVLIDLVSPGRLWHRAGCSPPFWFFANCAFFFWLAFVPLAFYSYRPVSLLFVECAVP
jgi:hypothetical protein